MHKKTLLFIGILIIVVSIKLQSQSLLFEEEIRLELSGAIESYVIDMNNDGYKDILSASTAKKIVMWLGDGNLGYSPVVISEDQDVGRGIRGGDINGDGLNDIVVASFNNNAVKIFVNNGNGFNEFILDSNFIAAHTPSLNDLDGDGDIDIVCSAFNTEPDADKLSWWENKGELNFEKHTLSTTFNSATIVSTNDFDYDGDYDILICSESLGDVVLWENNGNADFTQNIIVEDFTAAHTVNAFDIDNDGDKDIVGCSYETGNLYWWQNDGNLNFTRIPIGKIDEALWISSADLDNDSDNDLIATGGEGAFWFENDGGLNFTKHSFPGENNGGYYITASDMDNDTDLDIVAGSVVSGKVIVWENTLYNIDFSAVPVTGNAPLTVKFTDETYGLGEVQIREWDFDNDGIVDSYEQNPEWTFSEPGTYNVKCKISFEVFAKTIVKKSYIKVFDGESSIEFETDKGYGRIPSDAQLNLNNEFTVELHFYPTDWGVDVYGSTLFDKDVVKISLIGKGFGSVKNHGILLVLKNAEGSNLRFSSPDSVYTLNRWQHLAVTFDQANDKVKLYLNGNPVELNLIGSGSYENGLIDNSDIPVILGKDQNEEYGYNGNIDELRIWNVVRSQEDIAGYINNYLSGNESGLTAYFKMNEGNGEVLKDELNNYEGTLVDINYTEGVDFSQITSVNEISNFSLTPGKFILEQNYPNPFNPVTKIKYTVPIIETRHASSLQTSLIIYDILGREVATLVSQVQNPGNYEITFDATGLTSGVYFYQLKADSYVSTKKMILLR